MKKKLTSIVLLIFVLFQCFCVNAEFQSWDSPREIPEDEYKTPWTEEGNPFCTYYAPWLRQMHIMTATEAENNKAAGIVGGEACQKVRQLAISPVDSDIMYFITNTSGIYKTENGGEHWYNVTNNAAGHDAKGLLCDNKDTDIVYAYMRKTGVHRSIDGGKTWHQLVADTDQKQDATYRSETIAQDDDGNTYMAVGSGIYKLERDTDKLTNLTAASFPALAALTENDSAEFLDLDVSPDGMTIYACCTWVPDSAAEKGVQTGLYVSTDGGNTWVIRTAGMNSSGSQQTYEDFRTLAIDPSDLTSKTIYAGLRIKYNSEGAPYEYKLCRSTDGGKTFTEIYTPLNNSNKNIYFYGLKFGPKNSEGICPLYMCLNGNVNPLCVSYDYFKDSMSFSKVYTDKLGIGTIRETSPTPSKYQAFAPDMKTPGRVIFAALGINEYILNDDNTSTINRISSGFSGASAEDIAFDNEGRMFMPIVDVGSYVNTGNIYSKDSYPTFKEGSGISRGVRAIFAPDDKDHVIVYIGQSNGYDTYSGIKQSNNGGETFASFNADATLLTVAPAEDSEGETEEDLGDSDDEEADSGDSNISTVKEYATYGNAQVLCYDNDDTLNGKKSTIYSSYHTSRDNGETWTKNEYFILDVHPENTKLQIGIKGTEANTELYKTTDGGVSWTKVMNLPYSDFLDVDFDLSDSNKVWFARKKMLGRIDLSAKNVEDYSSKFTYQAFSNIEINPKHPDHILVTSYPGVHVDSMKDDFKLAESYDGGESWHTVPGLWGKQFNNIIFSKNTDEVFITGLQGTYIYDYTKFNYYQLLRLWHNGKCVKTTLPRINDSGVNVNNGAYVTAPEDVFNLVNRKLTGWRYKDVLYKPGEKMPIEAVK